MIALLVSYRLVNYSTVYFSLMLELISDKVFDTDSL